MTSIFESVLISTINKYKIVGIINLFFGVTNFAVSVFFPLSVFPKLSRVYSDVNVSSQPNLTSGYIVVILFLIIAITNLFLGVKGFTGTKEKEKYFKYGIISAIATFFMTGILVAILNLTTVSQIYDLTSQF